MKKLELMLLQLCVDYKVGAKRLIVDSSRLTQPEALGQYNPRINAIVLADDLSADEMAEIVCHEFRHAWQRKYHKSIYDWWLASLPQRIEAYRHYYWHHLNAIEADARVFGKSLGSKGREDLLGFYSPDQLTMFEKHSELDLAAKTIAAAVSRKDEAIIWDPDQSSSPVEFRP